NGWYPIFFENHDKPRSVHNFFSDDIAEDTSKNKLAAKALATLMMTLRGTPFLFEGQEIGMTNVKWDSIEMYDEVNSRTQYRLALQEGFSNGDAMKFVNRFSRDNARTPMQWNANANAGFTLGKPWLSLNENYREINVASEEGDDESVLNFYKVLISLRKNSPVLNGGDLQIILEDHPQIFGFQRLDTALNSKEIFTVLVNLGDSEVTLDESLFKEKEKVLSNYGEGPSSNFLRPLEALILCSSGGAENQESVPCNPWLRQRLHDRSLRR
ncbi:MAG: hypothetical protein HUK20_12760, partial [Fibrobacter sp.]|nr:hypothetical protein [Fibrobacter sp.]